jgi:ornithine cyclodeaminase
MPSFLPSPKGGILAVKLITLFHGNAAVGLESHQGVIVVIGGDRGEPLALIEAASVTALRTAAVSALATRLLARPDSRSLAIVGTGVQAKSHLDAMLAVLPIERVRIWGRTTERARALAATARDRYPIAIEVAATAQAAVRDADVVCTVTAAREPVVHGDWVRPGTHINAVGSSTPGARELDSGVVARAAVFVDSREAALAEAGDLLIPIREGAITREHIRAELSALVAGTATARENRDQVTLFKSLGLAVEDAAAARRIYERALELGAGTRIRLSEAAPPG